MAKQVLWNKPIYDEFCRLAELSEDERNILQTRMQGWSITRQSLHFHKSVSSINRMIAILKKKYDAVQIYSDVLPKRKFSAKETYMDTH